MFGNIHQILRVGVIPLLAKIGLIGRGGIALAIEGELHQRRVREEDKLITATLLCRLHKILISCAFAPIIVLTIDR